MTITVQRRPVKRTNYGLSGTRIKPVNHRTDQVSKSNSSTLVSQNNQNKIRFNLLSIVNSILLLTLIFLTGNASKNIRISPNPKLRTITQTSKQEEKASPPIAYKNIKEGTVNASILTIDLNSKDIQVRPVLAHNRVGKIETVSSMVKRENAIAGINAGFYDYYATNMPIGLIMIDKKVVASNMGDWNRSIFAIDDENKAHILRPNEKPKVKINGNGFELIVHGVNRHRYSNSIIIFTPEHGESTRTNNSGTEIIVSNGKIVKINSQLGNSPIPKDGFVISIHEKASSIINKFKIGEIVTIETTLPPGIKHAVLAGPTLIKDGEINITFKQEKFNPNVSSSSDRAAIGIAKNNKLIFIRGHDSKNNFTFQELAKLLLNQGATQAIACDGGGSSSLVYKGKGVSNRAVSNAMLVWHINHE